MLAGIIIATVFDSSLRVSTSTIDDITSGFMKEVIVSPIPRWKIAVGQFASSATVATIQGMIIFSFGFLIGLQVTSIFTVIYAILAMAFVGLVFSGFGLLIATKAKNIQTFQAISMAITMPMTFLSGAYIPLSMLNNVLTNIAYFNPMTYAVAFFRTIVLEQQGLSQSEMINQGLAFEIGNFVIDPTISMLILLIFGLFFLTLSTISFIKVDFSKINRNKKDAMEFE